MEKYSFFAVRFDHETGEFDLGGELIEGVMDGTMVFYDEKANSVTWGYPKTEEEISKDALAEKTLYNALCNIKVP